jgi:hypothetical protein
LSLAQNLDVLRVRLGLSLASAVHIGLLMTFFNKPETRIPLPVRTEGEHQELRFAAPLSPETLRFRWI